MRNLLPIWVVMVLMVIGVFVFAEQGSVKKAGYDLYWKNKIALAPEAAIVNYNLVPDFLEATEGFATDGETGDLLTGSIRRSVSHDRRIGWIMEVIKQSVVTNDSGEVRTFYNIETQLVFDLRVAK